MKSGNRGIYQNVSLGPKSSKKSYFSYFKHLFHIWVFWDKTCILQNESNFFRLFLLLQISQCLFSQKNQAHLYYKVLDVYTSPFKKIKFLLNISGEIFFKVDHFKPFFCNFPIVQCLTFLAPTVQHQTDCNTRLSAPSS